jgi:V/A-type H+/Na+-transporting ATPase subunit I
VSTVVMRKLEIVSLKRDMNAVLEGLGHAGCFQIALPESQAEKTAAAPGASPPEADRPAARTTEGAKSDGAPVAGNGAVDYSAALDELEELRRSLGLQYPASVPEGTRLPGPEEEAALEAMRARASGIDEAVKANAEKAAKAREALEESSVFAGLDLPYRELDQLSFLTVRIGRVDTEELPKLREALGDRAIALAVGRKGDIVAVASRRGRFALDTELTRAGFTPRQFSVDFKGVPPELPAALERTLAELDAQRTFLERERKDLREELSGPWSALAASYAVASSVEEARVALESSAQAYRLEGWAPEQEVGGLTEAIRSRTEGRAAIRCFAPSELESVASGEEEVPVLLKRRGFVSSFERMVLSFGTPQYGSVDPTPFVSVFFVLFFTIMFGDVGQGFLILAGALAIRLGLWLKKWKAFAPIGIACGIGSIVMGFLTGSCFTFEEALVPLTRALSGALFGKPVDRFLTLMPEGGSGKILTFFGFTVALGVIVNSTGLLINMVDRIRAGKKGEALFSKTGLAGATLFWWAIGMGVRAVAGAKFGWFDAFGLGIPLLCLMFEERLADLVDGRKYVNHDGGFAAGVKGFVAVLESVSYFLSNTLSFLRVGAFALSHVVLSFIIFTMGEMVGQAPALGILWRLLVLLFGNSIIIFLEGMIVAIQIVRLQYYEFLSKFLTETGSPFVPFKFQFRKEQP